MVTERTESGGRLVSSMATEKEEKTKDGLRGAAPDSLRLETSGGFQKGARFCVAQDCVPLKCDWVWGVEELSSHCSLR